MNSAAQYAAETAVSLSKQGLGFALLQLVVNIAAPAALLGTNAGQAWEITVLASTALGVGVVLFIIGATGFVIRSQNVAELFILLSASYASTFCALLAAVGVMLSGQGWHNRVWQGTASKRYDALKQVR